MKKRTTKLTAGDWEIIKHMAIELYPMDLEKQEEFVKREITRKRGHLQYPHDYYP